MMSSQSVIQFISLGIFLLLSNCAINQNPPVVNVLANESGISISALEKQAPRSMLPSGRSKPQIPASTVLIIERSKPLSNTKPRYFTPASGRLRVFRASDYRALHKGNENHLEPWDQLLQSESPLGKKEQRFLYQSQASEFVWQNAGRCFHAKLRKQSFPWGDAVMFLTHYVQGKTGGPVNNDMLVLVVQGLSKDQKYVLHGHFAISHPKLPQSLWDERTKGLAVFSLDNDEREAEKWLDKQADDSFSPNFAEYEEFLSAIQISES